MGNISDILIILDSSKRTYFYTLELYQVLFLVH